MKAGNYDEEAEIAQKACGERSTVLLMVIAGNNGSGFSVTTPFPEIAAQLPALMRQMATEIEHQLKQGSQ